MRLKADLKWLASVLGEVRNVDVLLAKVSDEDLSGKLKIARAAVFDKAADVLNSSRTRALMLDLVEWLECGDFLSGRDPAAKETPNAVQFAARVLEKQRKRLKKDGEALEKATDEHRHEVRKDAKKFRYAAEFFASLFSDKRGSRRHKKFIVAMEALQDDLGALNDLATGPDVLEEHNLGQHPARETVLAGGDKKTLIERAQASVDEVLDSKLFWR